jgi:hypothetical protein
VYCGDDDDDHDFVDDHDIDAVISSITSNLSINFISSINLIHSSIISVQILDGVQVYEARSRMGEKLALKILKVLGEWVRKGGSEGMDGWMNKRGRMGGS